MALFVYVCGGVGVGAGVGVQVWVWVWYVLHRTSCCTEAHLQGRAEPERVECLCTQLRLPGDAD